MADRSWASTPDLRALLATAEAFGGASNETLSHEDSTRAFVEVKTRLLAVAHPPPAQDMAGAGAGAGRSKSTPYRAAVFIFYYQDTRNIVPLGTAVAVGCRSGQILLTAGHCCFAEETLRFSRNLFCTKSLAKNRDGEAIVNGDFFPVEIIYCSKQPDIGILHRTDGARFARTIPLCPPEEIPWLEDHENWEAKAKCYHCPIHHFLLTSASIVSCEATNYHSVASVSDHHFTIREEFVGGSSGGAWVLPSEFGSKLIGILVSIESTPFVVVNAVTEPANPDGSIAHSVWDPSLTVNVRRATDNAIS